MIVDSLKITDQKMTPEGYLSVTARVSRTGIQEYLKREPFFKNLPDGLQDCDGDSILRLLRPKSEVFDDGSIASMLNKPVTDGHPPEFVNAENYSLYSKGVIVGQPYIDGDFVVADLLIQDKSLIRKIQNGTRQISLGYHLDTEWDEGFDADYGVYDGIQKNIRINHVAVVPFGRGGPNVRIQDESEANMASRIIDVDGISIEFNEQGAQVVDKLQAQIKDASIAINDATTKMQAAIDKAEKLEGQLAAKDKQIEELQAANDVEAKALSLLAAIDDARALVKDFDPKGLKSEIEVKKAALKALDAKKDFEQKSSEYIDGMFDALLETKKGGKENQTAMDNAVAASVSAAPKNVYADGLALLKKRSEVKAWDKTEN